LGSSQQSLQGSESVILGRTGPGKGDKENSVRIDLELVDRLMALAGEMVLARNRIIQQVGQINHPALSAASRQLNQVTTEMQEAVMKMRMYPISNLWSRLPRIVRDLAQQIGKKCRLEMEGGSTELDKNLIEAIKDPLTHLVRNAVDHGIESPGDRLKAGKPTEGKLALRARHESGQVIIELQDDGKGMDPDSIRSKAVERGIATRDFVDRQKDQDVFAYVFLPGFSTARAVTQVSGRGIGMDVVKTNIESLGGGIDIDSLPGKGTTVRLRIPLTLAIVNALVVVSGDSYLALPQSGIVELLRLQGQRLKTLVETSAGTKVLRFRGRLLPLLDLRTILNPAQDKPIEDEDSAISIVVVRGEGRIFALSVDRILDAQEIVVKPLPAPLRHLAVYGGTTLLGDGSVALILDIPGLADAGGVSGEAGASTDIPPAQASAEQVRPLLLVELVAGRRHGFLLDRVERLEEIESSKIEITSRGMVTPYRGGLLPLINLPELFGGNSVPGRENIHPVVVHSQKSGLYGIMVRQILNTVEEPWTIATGGVSPGIAALALVRGRPTEILDPSYWCDQGVHHG
jgi:two-component system chemotaxis sensor kinase CheA